jgi:hypothetical protein
MNIYVAFLFCLSEHSIMPQDVLVDVSYLFCKADVFHAMIKTLHVHCLIVRCCVFICAGAGVFCEPVWHGGSLAHQLWHVIRYTNQRYF